MVLLCDIRSNCYLYLLFVMATEHNLVLSTPLIVVLGVWSVADIMKFMTLLMTLFLWSGRQLQRRSLCVIVLMHGTDTLIGDLCVYGV